MSQRGIGANSAVMAAGTVLSRITGMVRDVALVAAIGTSIYADTYSVANTLPNIVYILIVGGALNAVFVPQLVRRMSSDADRGAGYADRLLTLVTVTLLVLTIVTMALAPLIVQIYGSSEWSGRDVDVAVAFAIYCLPQIFFYGVYTMLSQVLNARGVFGLPMFAPIVNNIVVIGITALYVSLVGYGSSTATVSGNDIALLGIGTTAGIAVQALILIPALRRVDYRWKLRFDWRGYGLGKAFTLAKWTILLVLVNQIAYAVITRLATTANVNALESGATATGFTSYLRAHLLFILPHSVITVSIVTALLPRMSKAAHEGRLGSVAADVTSGARTVGALLIPAAAAFIALGPVIGRLLYGHGASSPASGAAIGSVLAMFAIGLPAYSIYYVILRGFYALEDTRTPFYLAIVLNIVNVLGALWLFAALDSAHEVAGLALAYSVAYILTTALSWWVLAKRIGGLHGRTVVAALARMGLAAAIAAGLISLVIAQISERSFLADALVTFGGGLTLVLIYAALAHLMRVQEIGQALAIVKARLARS